MDTQLREIGLAINRRMDEMNIGVSRLSELSGVCKVTIYRIVKGQNYDIKNLHKINKPLGLKIKLESE